MCISFFKILLHFSELWVVVQVCLPGDKIKTVRYEYAT